MTRARIGDAGDSTIGGEQLAEAGPVPTFECLDEALGDGARLG